tara:strand:- start:1305 stop:1664 length:360 start_codon:yes stop_codon:yes gene_type:complete
MSPRSAKVKSGSFVDVDTEAIRGVRAMEAHLGIFYPHLASQGARALALQWIDDAPLSTYSCECCAPCRALSEHAKYRAACTLCGVDPARSQGQFAFVTPRMLAVATRAALTPPPPSLRL